MIKDITRDRQVLMGVIKGEGDDMACLRVCRPCDQANMIVFFETLKDITCQPPFFQNGFKQIYTTFSSFSSRLMEPYAFRSGMQVSSRGSGFPFPSVVGSTSCFCCWLEEPGVSSAISPKTPRGGVITGDAASSAFLSLANRWKTKHKLVYSKHFLACGTVPYSDRRYKPFYLALWA